MRKIWRLPRQCHTRILHCVAGVQSFNKIPDLFSRFVARALASKSSLIRSVFLWASAHAYSAVGANFLLKEKFTKLYSNEDMFCGDFVRDIRLGCIYFSTSEETSLIINTICCD